MDLSRKVGENIKKFRKAKGISQQELANRTDFHQSQIYMLENGKRNFNSHHLEKISQALDVPVIKFFEEERKIERELEEQKLIDKISRMKPDRRKEIIDFLLNLDDNIDVQILKKALEIAKIAKKK